MRSLIVACALVATCIGYIPHRGEIEGPALRGDAVLYADMVRGDVDVEAPFRYRVVVPLLARAMPLSPAPALACISWLSLVGTYTLILQIARRLLIPFVPAVLGLCAAIAAAPHLYNYANPYITDALGLLVVALCAYALVARHYLLFAVTSAFGIGVREALVFVSLGWAHTREWLRSSLCLGLAIVVYGTLRSLVGPGETLDEGPFASFPAHSLSALLGEALSAWHMLWLIAPLGLSLLSTSRNELVFKALPLLFGAVITSLLATDTVRMFQPLFPFVALGVGRFIEVSWRSARWATVLWLVTCACSSWVWQPVRVAALRLDHATYLRAHQVALVALIVAGIVPFLSVLRERLRTAPLSLRVTSFE